MSKESKISKFKNNFKKNSKHYRNTTRKHDRLSRPSINASQKNTSSKSKNHTKEKILDVESSRNIGSIPKINNDTILKSNQVSATGKKVSRQKNKRSEKDILREAQSNVVTSAPFKITVGIVIAAIIIIVGVVIGIAFYMNSTSSKMALDDKAKEKLAKVQEGSSSTILFAVDIDKTPDGKYDMLLLGNAISSKKKVVFLAIPLETYVPSTSGGGTTLGNIAQTKGDGDLIESVSQFVETGINHFVKTNAEGLKSIVDSVGGIEVNVVQPIDEPDAGQEYIPAGKSTINGNQCLTFLRAKKFDKATERILTNQCCVGEGLSHAVLNFDSREMSIKLEQISENLQTDLNVGDCMNLLNSFKDTERNNIMGTYVPGYKAKRNNQDVYITNSTDWKDLKLQFNQGDISTYRKEATINDINPSSFTIHVQNGSGIDGAGAYVEQKLKEQGYNVIKTDNANTSAYQETLIIYGDAAMKKNAEAVKSSLNNGRLVEGNGLYTMDSDILIIIGSDLKI